MGEWTWAGSHELRASRVARPSSVAELAQVLAGADHARALGTRHSFNDIADPGEAGCEAGVLVETGALPSLVEVDSARRVARVGAGMTYAQVTRALDKAGFALEAMASLPHISVGGAIATGTHGSGDATRSLASAVVGLEMVRPDGEQVAVRLGEADFAGAVVGLGALGVTTAVELALVPRYELRQDVVLEVPWEQVLADLDAVTGAGQSVSLFSRWGGNVTQMWVKSRDLRHAPETFGGRLAARQMHPLAEADGQWCTAQLGVPGPWHERLPHFRPEFTPSAGQEIQAEYLVPREQAVGAIEAMRGCAGVLDPALIVGEVRTVAADESWLGMSSGRDSVALHLTMRPEPEAVRTLLPVVEEALGPFEPRAHWGKWFHDPSLVRGYPHLEDFRELVTRWDPRGVLRNDFLERTVFG